MTPQRFFWPRLVHSSQSSAMGELGVIGKIAMASLTRYATEAAASLPSTVIWRLLDIASSPLSDSLTSGVSDQHRYRTTGGAGPDAVGSTGEDDRDSGSQDQAGAVGVGEK